jgi:hypothetical protein
VNFLTVVPGDYPVPTAGATGSVLEKLGRHVYRACHIHYMIQAPGHEPLTTMMYFNHSPYVDSDTIFSVKNFRVDITKHDDPAEIKAKGLDRPFYTLDYTFVVPCNLADVGIVVQRPIPHVVVNALPSRFAAEPQPWHFWHPCRRYQPSAHTISARFTVIARCFAGCSTRSIGG